MDLAIWDALILVLVSFPYPPILSFSYFSVPQDASGSSCILCAFSLGINYFSKEPWFFLLEMVLRNQDLDPKCVNSYWDVTVS